jgi:hypothetical protein
VTDNLESPTWVTSHQGSLPGLSVRRCRLDVTSGPDAGLVVELAQPRIVIGRGPADVTLTDRRVSALHCELTLEPAGYRLRDLDSTNGTRVFGVRVDRGATSSRARRWRSATARCGSRPWPTRPSCRCGASRTSPG